MMKIFLKPAIIAISLGGVMMLGSCGKKPNHPGLEFMPDMYRSPSYSAYQSNPYFKDSVSALRPVAGTIPRGYNTYFPYSNTNEGYEAAGTELKNTLTVSNKNTEEGKRLFGIYCQHCHGEKGDGQGTLKIKGDKFPVPSYFDDLHINLPEGKMFFSVTYGKNLMGPHASQLDPEQRWKVIHYIKSLQQQAIAEKNKSTAKTDSASTAMTK